MLTGLPPLAHQVLHNADVLAYPSLDEGFGFPILEAQQAGTPVVASTAGSIPEVAGDAAPLAHALRGIEQQILRAGEVLDELRALCLQRQAADPDELEPQEGGWHR